MHYTRMSTSPSVSRRHHARRQFRWLLRYLHANAPDVFLSVYIHMSAVCTTVHTRAARGAVDLGVIIYLLMMATGFMATCCLGQMSFWRT